VANALDVGWPAFKPNGRAHARLLGRRVARRIGEGGAGRANVLPGNDLNLITVRIDQPDDMTAAGLVQHLDRHAFCHR